MTNSTRGPVTLAELTSGLIWPRVLRAFPMSAAPSRLLIGFVCAASIAAIGSLFDSVRGSPLSLGAGVSRGVFETLADAAIVGASNAAWGVVTLDPQAVAGAVAYAADRIGATVTSAPWSTLALAALLAPIFVICGLALCRSVACDAAWRQGLGARAALRFGVTRSRSGLGAFLIPALAVGGIGLLLLAIGWLMRWPVLDVAGGLLYGLLLLLGGVIVFLLVGVAFAHALLLPAVATDGADAIDAVQRAYAYLYGRPGRMLLYLAPLLLIGAVALIALTVGVVWTINLTAGLTNEWAGDAAPLGGGVIAADWSRVSFGAAPDGTRAVASWLVRFWEGAFALLLTGWVISYHFTGGTILYLLLRRVNDEQDIEDIWPGPASTISTAVESAPTGAAVGAAMDE